MLQDTNASQHHLAEPLFSLITLCVLWHFNGAWFQAGGNKNRLFIDDFVVWKELSSLGAWYIIKKIEAPSDAGVQNTMHTFHLSGQCLLHIWTSGRFDLHFVYSIMFQPSLRLRAIWCVWLMSHIFRPTVTLVWTLIQDKRTHSECAFPEWGFFYLVCSVRIDKRNLRTPDYCEVRKTLVLMSTTWLNVDFVNIHWTRLQSVQNFLQSEKCEQGPNRAERQADKTSDVNSAASEDRIQSDSRLLFSALLSPQKRVSSCLDWLWGERPHLLSIITQESVCTPEQVIWISSIQSGGILTLRSSIKKFPPKKYIKPENYWLDVTSWNPTAVLQIRYELWSL